MMVFPEGYPLPFWASAVLLAAGCVLYTVIVWRRDSLSHIPYHRFDRDDTTENYIQHSDALLHSGYLKVPTDLASP